MDSKTIETSKVRRFAVNAATIAVFVDIDDLPTAKAKLKKGCAVGGIRVEGKQFLPTFGNGLRGLLPYYMTTGKSVGRY